MKSQFLFVEFYLLWLLPYGAVGGVQIAKQKCEPRKETFDFPFLFFLGSLLESFDFMHSPLASEHVDCYC